MSYKTVVLSLALGLFWPMVPVWGQAVSPTAVVSSPLEANKRYVDTPVAQAAAPAAAPSAAPGNSPLYRVEEGYKVDPQTLEGFRTWRVAGCDRCHGANQEGLVGPSLIERMRTLSKEEFITVVRDGRLEKGMQSFGSNQRVMDNIHKLYAYLKGRSDGAITRARVEAIP